MAEGVNTEADILNAIVNSSNALPWGGDDPATFPGAEVIIANAQPLKRSSATLLDFFGGKQWPKEVEEFRRERNAPCLVLNRLPALVEIALSRASVKLTDEMKELLILQITDRNYDAQRAHNYFYSAAVERAGLLVQAARAAENQP